MCRGIFFWNGSRENPVAPGRTSRPCFLMAAESVWILLLPERERERESGSLYEICVGPWVSRGGSSEEALSESQSACFEGGGALRRCDLDAILQFQKNSSGSSLKNAPNMKHVTMNMSGGLPERPHRGRTFQLRVNSSSSKWFSNCCPLFV